MAKLKILHLNEEHIDHASNLMSNIVIALVGEGHEVVSAYLKGPINNELSTELGCEIKSFDCKSGSLKYEQKRVIRELKAYIHAEKFDVIIAHRFRSSALLAKATRGIDLSLKLAIFHGIGHFRRYRRKLFARFYLSDWHELGVSQAVCEDLLHSKSGFTPECVHVINNGIDIVRVERNFVDRDKARDRFAIGPDEFVFGTIGRLASCKGHKYLIDAFSSVLSLGIGCRLLIVGGGKLEYELKNQLVELGLADKVILAGSIPKAHSLLKGFDCFILPSLTEAFPIVLLEAMVAKLPIIGTDVGGVPVALGDIGQLAESASSEALAKEMTAIIQRTAEERERTGNAFYHRVNDLYGIVQYRKNYTELVAKLSGSV